MPFLGYPGDYSWYGKFGITTTFPTFVCIYFVGGYLAPHNAYDLILYNSLSHSKHFAWIQV
jgi:hypothetical protein